MEDKLLNSDKFYLSDVYYVERGDKNVFKISWKMTEFCPYSCSYCYMSNAVEKARVKKDNPTQELCEEIASKIDKYTSTRAKPEQIIHLHLIGGEVAIFDLISILNKIKRLNKLSIATNLYRPLEYWQKLKDYCKSRGFGPGISASFHLGMLDEKGRKNFCDKVLALHCQVKAIVNNDNIQEYKPYFDMFMEHKIPIEITFERDNENRGCKLTEENQKYIDIIRDYQYKLRGGKPYYIAHLKDGRTFEYSSNIALLNNTYDGILNFSGFYCNAGENNLRINQKGEMLRSACRICSSIMKIGKILEEDTWQPYEQLKPFICDCNHANKGYQAMRVLKGCTCFNNTEMWQPGYNRETGEYIPKEEPIPDYHSSWVKTSGFWWDEIKEKK